jgi:NADPH2:quinone reductase
MLRYLSIVVEREATMWQVRLDAFGGPDELHLVEVPDPVPGAGQVLVRTAAAGITFVETQVRAGRPPWPGPGPALPVVLGNGVEGEVIGAGEGVDPSWLGRRVVTSTGGSGGYADHVVVDAAAPISVPDGLGLGEAVALLADGRTALGLVRAASLAPGDRVLVTAAAGGVGSLLVQLARAAGVKQVVAAAGGERKLALAAGLGADATVDYTRPGWADALDGLDVGFDGVGGDVAADLLAAMTPGGRVLVYGGAGGPMTTADAVTARGLTLVPGHTVVRSPEDNRALVEQALAMAAAGRLRPVIGQRFALARAADAHRAIEARQTLGKTILIPAG